MRHAVSAAVSVFPLAALFGDALMAPSQSGLHVVLACLELIGGLGGGGVAVQEVACVLHVSAHTQLLVAVGLIEPVLSLYVVGLLLPGAECRGREAHAPCLARLARYLDGAEEGAEEVALLSVEIYFEALHVLQRAEFRLAAGWLEVVSVLADVAYAVDGPVLARCPAGISLVVEESWLVFALGLQASQHILIGLVSYSIAEGEALVAVSGIHVGAQQTGQHACFGLLRTGIGDVEHAAHAVAVFRFEASRTEVHLFHHVAVDDREALLLPTADEQRTIYLHTVYRNAVLIEGTSTHVVLARQLVVCADTCLCGNEFLHCVARRTGHALQVFRVELLCGAQLPARVTHHHLAHLLAAAAHDDV